MTRHLLSYCIYAFVFALLVALIRLKGFSKFPIYSFKTLDLFKQVFSSPQYSESMEKYTILLSQLTWDEKVVTNTGRLKSGELMPGNNYLRRLARSRVTPNQLTPELHLRELLNTKKPQIFAESAVAGDGSDWTQEELSILGDVSIAIPVTIYDNARHMKPLVHSPYLNGHLIFTPGALLTNSRGVTPCDAVEVLKGRKVDPDGYFRLYERRLMPGLIYANDLCKTNKETGLVTVPGMGCGMFAGTLRGTLGEVFKDTLKRIIEKHTDKLTHIKAIYYDPYNECQNERYEIGHTCLLVRPLTLQSDPSDRSQLSHPKKLQDQGDEFSRCKLFSIVAWDHVSWPGNDFYAGSRATDDGVKGAATNALGVMTQTVGEYCKKSHMYLPPKGFKNWEDVVKQKKIDIDVDDDNVRVVKF